MADWVGRAPLWVGPHRQPPRQTLGGGSASARPVSITPGAADGDNEEALDEQIRNRQKELQDHIVAAEDPEAILSTIRELDGGIVISTALHRLGKVASGAEMARDPRFGLLLQRFKARLPFFGSRQIANSLHGLGAMLFRAGGDWIEMASIQTQRRIRDFEPQHTSNTLWAYARMQLNEPLMLRALCRRAVEDIGRFCPLDVSIVTWAMATVKHKDMDWFRAVVRTRLEFADFSPQNMSNFVWGLATLGLRNDNMVLACGREAARKIQDFIPQELSNFCWALATMDLCDNLWLRAVAEEVERRADELHSWDPQSLSNMMWAYATLAIKDDPLFALLLDASVARVADSDSQNLANSSWAAAMVSFRSEAWLRAVAQATVPTIGDCQTLHLAQLAFAFCRFIFKGEEYGLMRALHAETLRRVAEFAPQSLFDVHDALVFFGTVPKSGPPNCPIFQRLASEMDEVASHLDSFALLCARGRPTADQVAAYRRTVVDRDVVTIGAHWTEALLRRCGMLCPEDDRFLGQAREQIIEWRRQAAEKDPVSRSIFHRAQCAWQLGLVDGSSGRGAAEALADGVFESGEPTDGGPEQYGLFVCRLRHPREGDAEIQALCAALRTSALRGGAVPRGVVLNLHLSDLPCVSCLGATLQFHRRFPGVLRVSFDRGRLVPKDVPPVPRPPPPPSRRGNAQPYAPQEPLPKTRGEALDTDAVDRSMLRRDGPDCRDTTSFYRGSKGPRRVDGAGSGGMEAVPHKVLANLQGASRQTYYFSTSPEFYGAEDYGA